MRDKGRRVNPPQADKGLKVVSPGGLRLQSFQKRLRIISSCPAFKASL